MKWRDLDDLPCVKRYVCRHKLAHYVGIPSHTKCFIGLSYNFFEGIIRGMRGREAFK